MTIIVAVVVVVMETMIDGIVGAGVVEVVAGAEV